MHNTELQAGVVSVDWCVAEATDDTETVYLPNQCAAVHAVLMGGSWFQMYHAEVNTVYG